MDNPNLQHYVQVPSFDSAALPSQRLSNLQQLQAGDGNTNFTRFHPQPIPGGLVPSHHAASNNPLMDLDISTSKFTKAIRFDSLPQGDGPEDELLSQTEDDESLYEQEIVPPHDTFEQQQAQEQARLLDRFQQLRQWQQQQQTLLMQQQQQQLQTLHIEQQRMQEQMVQQRQQQIAPPKTVRPNMPQNPSVSDANLDDNYAALPQQQQYLGGMDNQHMTSKKISQIDGMVLPPQEITPPKGDRVPLHNPQPIRPAHHLQKNPQILNRQTASNNVMTGNLYNHTGHQVPMSSEGQIQLNGMHNNVEGGRLGTERLQRTVLPPEAQNRLNGVPASEGEILNHKYTNPTSQPQTTNQMGDYNDIHGRRPPPQQQNKMPLNMTGNNSVAQQQRVHQQTTAHPREQTAVPDNYHQDQDRQRTHAHQPAQVDEYIGEESYEEDEPEYDNSESEEEENEQSQEEMDDDSETEPTPVSFDDQPVVGLAAKKLTFEELLEEELKKEAQKAQTTQPQTTLQKTAGKKFLRKGEGVSRVTMPQTKRAKPKSHPTSKQRENVPVKNKIDSPPKAENKTEGLSRTNPAKTYNAKVTASSSTRSAMKPGQGLKLVPQKVKKTSAAQTPPDVDVALPSKPNAVSTPIKLNKEDRVADSLGETSFVAKLNNIKTKEVVEVHELEEFELLEQYADDNASFMSSVSAVNRVIEKDRKADHRPSLLNNRNVASKCVHDDSDTDDNVNSMSSDTDTSQMSDTETQSSSDDTECDEKHEPAGGVTPGEQSGRDVMPAAQRKVVTINKASEVLPNTSTLPSGSALHQLPKVQHFTDSDDMYSNDDGDSVTKHPALSDKTKNRETTAVFKSDKKPAIPPQNNKSPNAIESTRNHRSPHSSPRKVHSKSHVHAGDQDTRAVGNMSMLPKRDIPQVLDFEDEDTWDEGSMADESESESEDEQITSRKSALSEPVPERKSAFTKEKVNQAELLVDSEHGSSTPPTSNLVTKLFPRLKPPPPPIPTQQSEKLQESKAREIGDGAQSQVLREKLQELEREIERFREENTALAKLRKDREDALELLKKEMHEFDTQKNDELKRLQDFKNTEMRKLKQEKKQFEQYQKAVRARPDKHDKKQLEEVKEQMSSLQDEVKRKEQRWTASSGRLRDRVSVLETENSELREELKVLEQRRLQQWQKNPQVQQPESQPTKQWTKNQQVQQTESQPPKQWTKNSHGKQPESQTANRKEHTVRELLSSLPMTSSLPLAQTSAPDPESYPLSATDPKTAKADTELRLSNTTNPSTSLEDKAEEARNSQKLSTGSSQTKAPSPRSDNDSGNGRKLPRKTLVATGLNCNIDKGDEKYEETQHPDGKIERVYSNDAREIFFANGTKKQISPDGLSVIVSFFNGDIKQILPDQRVVYYYADAQTTHTTYPDALEILQFTNGQMEKHYPDGTREITFPDQTIKYLFPNGTEESIFPDGTVIRVEKNGNKSMEFPNGQREVHTEQYKRREYPDGTVKTVFPDGKQETRYSSGRMRVKDKDGNIIMDRKVN